MGPLVLELGNMLLKGKTTPKNVLGRCIFARLLNGILQKLEYFVIRRNFMLSVGK